MDVVMIGVDPHKRSVTIEARDAREVLRATGSFPTTTAGYRAMLRYCRQWPPRVWAVEGAWRQAGRRSCSGPTPARTRGRSRQTRPGRRGAARGR